MNSNTIIYLKVLDDLINKHRVEGISGIAAEMLSARIVFSPDGGTIEGSSEVYLSHEFSWYSSMDLSIKGHPGIETNPIWKGCATDDGYVNSNYGWCVYSENNGGQFKHALNALLSDKHSRRAVLIYTRPSIHVEQCDNIHAKQDMMCTCYTMFLIRDGKLNMHVHMRSNDVIYGLRYDLAWQIYVYKHMLARLSAELDISKGDVVWIVDSLHLYERDMNKAKMILEAGK